LSIHFPEGRFLPARGTGEVCLAVFLEVTSELHCGNGPALGDAFLRRAFLLGLHEKLGFENAACSPAFASPPLRSLMPLALQVSNPSMPRSLSPKKFGISVLNLDGE